MEWDFRHLADFQRAAVDVRLNGRHIEDRHGDLGIRGLGSELVVCIPETLANRVHPNECTGTEKVLSLQAAGSHWVLLRPDAIGVLGQKLGGSELVTGVAPSRWLCISEIGGATGGHGGDLGSILYMRLTSRATGGVCTSASRIVGGCREGCLKSLTAHKRRLEICKTNYDYSKTGQNN
jgi:hypothetical protein